MLHQPALEPTAPMRETALYAPVKRFLEGLGFDVKGEICGCDLVALRADEPPIVVVGELKLGFNLELVLQGINRSSACDEIWLTVRASARAGRERDPRVRKLCRFLGFGLLGVSSTGVAEVLVEPLLKVCALAHQFPSPMECRKGLCGVSVPMCGFESHPLRQGSADFSGFLVI